MKATLAIQRGIPSEPPRVEDFEVTFEPGQSVFELKSLLCRPRRTRSLRTIAPDGMAS
jgi:hypothetical protein